MFVKCTLMQILSNSMGDHHKMSYAMRKPDFCICKNKGTDQLHGNHAADQRLCFRYKGSTVPLLSKSKISIVSPSSGAVQPGLCKSGGKPRTGFRVMSLKLYLL